MGGRSYSDDSYGSKKSIRFPATGVLNGTSASAVVIYRHSFMEPATVTDVNAYFLAGGTNSTRSLNIGFSLAGTGAVTAIGTIATGTTATAGITEGSATQTDFATGDHLVLQSAAGTSTTVENLIVCVQYKERFVASDS